MLNFMELRGEMAYEIKAGEKIEFRVGEQRLAGTVITAGDRVTVRDDRTGLPWTYRRSVMDDVAPFVPIVLPEWWKRPELYDGLVM
jgi:hypothetical protein